MLASGIFKFLVELLLQNLFDAEMKINRPTFKYTSSEPKMLSTKRHISYFRHNVTSTRAPGLRSYTGPAVISSESSRSGNDIVVLLKVLEAVKGDVLIICSEE